MSKAPDPLARILLEKAEQIEAERRAEEQRGGFCMSKRLKRLWVSLKPMPGS